MPVINSRGHEFHQLSERIPLLKWTYTSWEENYDTDPGVKFTKDNFAIPIVLVTVYCAAWYYGKKYMDTRERFDLRYQLAAWNAFLSIFSFIGAFRTVPHLLYNISNASLESTICTPADLDWGCGATGFWVQMFIFSKIPELWDTFYVVARKRPLLFLHWYHHVTVLLYCWHSYATEASQALYFVAMNYSVHAIMYGYYCLMALKCKPKWLAPQIITVTQISQMFVGTAVQIASMLVYKSGRPCNVDFSNLVAGALMYGSYFALFFQFALERFVFKKPEKKAAGSVEKAKKES